MSNALRILLIDDNPSDRALINRELQREFTQLEVQEIIDAQSFEQAIVNDQFDIVITDYQLHWTTGLDVLRTVKENFPRCPVVMVTNTGSEEIAVEALQSGLDDYILKAPNRYVRVPASVRLALTRAESQRRAILLEVSFRSLLNRLKVGVFRANSEGVLLSCNPAFLELLGVDSLEQAQALQPLNLKANYSYLSSLRNAQTQQQEQLLQRTDGRSLWIDLTTTLNRIDGEVLLDGLVEDITSRKQAELEIQQLNQSLEARVQERTAELEMTNQQLINANQELEEFAYSISHDLRAPLRIIQGFARLALVDHAETLNEEVVNYIQRILESSQRADVLITDLLTYSRIRQTNASLQPVDLSFLLADVLYQLEADIQAKQAQITIEEPLARVMANRSILLQVLTNLISNAIKFVDPAVQPRVRIWTVVQNQNIRLWIEDNGIGIEAEYQQHIFNVFARLHSSEEYEGTGIGLAIVRKGVERMGGQVGVESQLGQGSRFWIDLPTVLE